MKSVFGKSCLFLCCLIIIGCGSESSDNVAAGQDAAALPNVSNLPDASSSTLPTQDAAEAAAETTESKSCESTQQMLTQPLVVSCSYDNPFTQTSECRDYRGTWTEDEAKAECAQVFTGVSGTPGLEPCPSEGAIGVCSAETEPSKFLAVNFYEGDASQLASVCTQFLSGDYCAANEGTGPATQLNPLDQALESMVSDDKVTVTPECIDDTCLATLIEQRKGIWFTPKSDLPLAGLIIYPGAQVDPRAYAPVARQIAILGIKVVIVPMPGNLAITGIDRAKDVITSDINHWFIAGHSMGGAMAARFVNDFQSTPGISGVVLWAAYPDEDGDLSQKSIPVLSIAGSLDGVVSAQEIEAAKPFLPNTTEYQLLDGGNHAQFGTYGKQSGDLDASMSAREQQQLVSALTSHFIKRTVLNIATNNSPFFDSGKPSDLCIQGQLMFLGVQPTQFPGQVNLTEYTDVDLFAKSKPSMVVQGLQVGIEVQAMTRTYGNGMLPLKNPLLPGEVWCKMKTREAFEKATGIKSSGDAINCSQLNQTSLAQAAANLQTAQAKTLTAGTDIAYEAGVDWLKNGAVILDGQTIQSATIVVGDDQSLPEAFRNVVYCKLWSPARALYYLMTGH